MPKAYRQAMVDSAKPRLVGINHVALEVDDIDRALDFYGRLFDIELRSRSETAAFIDIGDQFLALMKGRTQTRDGARHVGLVVDDKEATRRVLEAAGVEIIPGRRLDFLDPFGNRVEIVQYDQIQFGKRDEVLRGMGLEHEKTEAALAELRDKKMA
jgi:lactoylglutathione lyase